jgi:NADH-quinone oxidoreductase subunit N
LLLLGIALVLAAFFFKVSGVPFHMWTPDVYQAAPLPITGFMATGVKIAAFAGLIRFLVSSHNMAGPGLEKALYVLALLTLLLGSMAALPQRNLKRLLAYSSITHVGYMVMAILPGSISGYGSVLFYLFTYLMVNVGLFSILICFSRQGWECATLDDLKGLGRQYPYMALLVGIFIFSLAGIPPTAGFMGKLTLFYAAVQGGYIGLTVIAVLTSAISLFYYLKILITMVSRNAEGTLCESARSFVPNPRPALIGGIAAAAIMIVGILPGSFINWAAHAARGLF